MFHLRSFVHQRLFAAAEEILGEVERTISRALHEADTNRPKQEPDPRRQKPDCLPHIPAPGLPLSAALTREEELEETSTKPSVQGDSELSPADFPGPSQTPAPTENGDFEIGVEIKEEQEDFLVDTQTEEDSVPPPEVGKSDQCQSEMLALYESQPVSTDCSVAGSGSSSDEEWVQNKRTQKKVKRRRTKVFRRQKCPAALSDRESPTKSQKDCRVCPICAKGFLYIRPFIKHLKTHEGSTESTNQVLCNLQNALVDSLSCEVCGKMFAHPGSLRMHLKIHSGIKDFECQDCGKIFFRKAHLMLHSRTHLGERPYHCDVCGKAFTQSSNLATHRRTHSGERPFHCGSCGKQFYTIGHLNAHVKRLLEENPFPCHICHKNFCRKRQLVQHRCEHAVGSTE